MATITQAVQLLFKYCTSWHKEWIKRNEPKHFCNVFAYRVKHSTILAFFGLGFYGLSRSYILHKKISAESNISLSLPNPLVKKRYLHIAKLSSSSSPVELSTALILIVSTHPHPPTPTRDSSNEALSDNLGGWNLVWQHYSTKLGQLTN